MLKQGILRAEVLITVQTLVIVDGFNMLLEELCTAKCPSADIAIHVMNSRIEMLLESLLTDKRFVALLALYNVCRRITMLS